MKGIDLRNFLYLNKISQDDAAKLIGVKRQTINNWCNKDLLTGQILTKAKFIVEHFSAQNTSNSSISNKNGVVINGDAHSVDINNDARQLPDELMEYMIHLKDCNGEHYIFSGGFKPGKKPMAPHQIGNFWAQMRDELKLPASYQFYSLKDTGITEMLEAGVPAKYVKELADHHSLEMTERYTHKSEAKKILEWNKIEF